MSIVIDELVPQLRLVSRSQHSLDDGEVNHSESPLTRQFAYWEWGDPNARRLLVCVHGLTRQGRDFDVLAKALLKASHQPLHIICPDIAGRGMSDWLANSQHYQVLHYAQDMQALLQQIAASATLTKQVDWVGTSMGGLIGMVMAGAGLWPLHKLVLNDVGPNLEWAALSRIAGYVGKMPTFESLEAGAKAIWQVSQGFGVHTWDQWLALSLPMFKRQHDGRYKLHYDPAIADAFESMTEQSNAQASAQLWALYDQIRVPTLVLRGAQSDLLTEPTLLQMAQRGPKAQHHTFAQVGHAPTLVAADQIAVVRDFLLHD